MAETVKRKTAAKKPSATASEKAIAAPPKKRATRAKVVDIQVGHDQIAVLAHHYWQERGYQHGHDAEDWFRAEAALLDKAS